MTVLPNLAKQQHFYQSEKATVTFVPKQIGDMSVSKRATGRHRIPTEPNYFPSSRVSFGKKMRSRANFTNIQANYTSEESLINAVCDKNTI